MALSKKKRVLITGGGGFIGANFAREFVKLGYKTYILKHTSDSWRLKGIKRQLKIGYIDLKNYNELESFILKIRPQIILHFAAYGVYSRKQQDTKKMIDTNLIGTINLVNALSKIKFDCLIYTGSTSEYGIKNKPMKETDLLEPNNLYGITKAAATMYCQYMAKKLNLPIVNTRLFAPYGYFEEKERLVPTIIKSCLENSELNLSFPNSVRDFIFTEDIIEAYLIIIKNIKKIKGEIFNIGTGTQTTIDELIGIIKKITGSTIKPKYEQVKIAQIEPKNWMADISKIKKILNWQPKYKLEEGLEKNIKWFKKNIYLYK